MKPSECGFFSPPPEDTPEREVMDRFAEFLRRVGPVAGLLSDKRKAELRNMMWGDDHVEWRRFIFGDPNVHGPAF